MFKSNKVKQFLFIGLSLFLFLFSLRLLVSSLDLFADYFQANFLGYLHNPFIGLFIGLLVTAVIQSSSTTSTMVLAFMAAGALEIQDAVPIIMGANIGTTLTSTIVALGFISDSKEFRKAISAGIIHDLFNISMVLVLFPLEYYYGLLSKVSLNFQDQIIGFKGMTDTSSLNFGIDLGLVDFVSNLIPGDFFKIVFALLSLYISIKLLTRVIQQTIIGGSKNILRRYIFEKPFKSFGWGLFFTAAIQSSSVSTSLIVPLVATSKVRLKNAFPFILGANLGTTITALLAGIFSSEAALSIALFHLIFNLVGVVLFMASGSLRRVFVDFTKNLSATITRKRFIGLAYVLVTFFLLPFILISMHKNERVIAGMNQKVLPVEQKLHLEKNLYINVKETLHKVI